MSITPLPMQQEAHSKGIDLLLAEIPPGPEAKYASSLNILENLFQLEIPPESKLLLWVKLAQQLLSLGSHPAGNDCRMFFLQAPMKVLASNPNSRLSAELWQQLYEAQLENNLLSGKHLAMVFLGLLSDDILKGALVEFLLPCSATMLSECDLSKDRSADEVLMLSTLVLKAAHFSRAAAPPTLLPPLFSALTRVLRTASTPEQLLRFLSESQDALILYLNDHKPDNLEGPKVEEWDCVKSAVETLWDGVLSAVQACHTVFDNTLVHQMTNLLSVTFSCKHRSIKSSTITFWQKTFAKADYLQYPEKLRAAIIVAQRLSKLTLPGWDAKEPGSPVVEHVPPEGKLNDRVKRKAPQQITVPSPKKKKKPIPIDQSQDYVVIPPKPFVDDDATQKEEYSQLPKYKPASTSEDQLIIPQKRDIVAVAASASPPKRQKVEVPIPSKKTKSPTRALGKAQNVSQEYSLQIVEEGEQIEPIGSQQDPSECKEISFPKDLSVLSSDNILALIENMNAFQSKLLSELRGRFKPTN